MKSRAEPLKLIFQDKTAKSMGKLWILKQDGRIGNKKTQSINKSY